MSTFLVGVSDETTAVEAAAIGARNGYVLELIENGDTQTVLQTFVFPIPPKQYDVSEPFANTITPTEGNSVIVEEYGTIIGDLRVEGTFGLSDKAVSGYEGAINAGGIPGNEHFALFRALFREYSRRKQDAVLGPKTELVWHSMREDDHFVIVPKTFDTPRSAQGTRLHYEYKIQAAIVAKAEDVQARTVAEDAGIEDVLETISRAFGDAQGALADVNQGLADIRRSGPGNVQAVFTQVAGLVTSVGNVLSGLAQTIEYPVQLAATICEQLSGIADDLAVTLADATVGTVAQGARDIRRLEAALDRIVQFPERFASQAESNFQSIYAGERRLTQRDIEEGTAGARPGSRVRVAYGTEGQAGIDLGRYTGAIAVPVERTTTLAGLAARYDVPPELIITLNDLRAPYFYEGGGPGCLGPGDTVLIPTTSGAPPTAAAPITSGYMSADEILYGRDLALDETLFKRDGLFEIRVDEAHGSMDAAIVGGIPCVVQGTRISVETERGTTVYIPDLGITRTVGKKGTRNSVILAGLYLRQAMLFDPRIDRILQSIVKLRGDVLSQDISVQLVGGRSAVTFVRPFGRRSGGS